MTASLVKRCENAVRRSILFGDLPGLPQQGGIKAAGRDTTVIDQVLVLPGASMALRIDCRMTSEGRVRIIKILKGHGHVDINYKDELRKPVEGARP